MHGGRRGRTPRVLPRVLLERKLLVALLLAPALAAALVCTAAALAAGTAPAAVPVPPQPGMPRVVRVEMTEFAFRPAVISLAAGRAVRLVFVNRGRLAHQFQTEYLRTLPVRIMDDSTLVEAPGAAFVRVEPDATASIEFYPRRPGRFAFACTIEGHAEAGMRGVLDVR